MGGGQSATPAPEEGEPSALCIAAPIGKAAAPPSDNAGSAGPAKGRGGGAAGAATRVTQGGEVAGGWAYATSRGQVVDIDDFTEIHELRLRAAYLFATVKQTLKPPPPSQRYE